ncbi:MAG: GTPase Era [Bacilli bacterium]|nr:GTPase Era [Bacilli bacterium]
MKSGFVSLIGRPNVGKSTLLNEIVGTKVAITSPKPQTTRNIIEGIYNDLETQIVFVDTPGIHKPTHKLGNVLNKQAYYSIDDVDVILFLVDASEELGLGDKYIIERLKEVTKPVLLILNKIDKIPKEHILEKIVAYQKLYDFKEYIPVSALKKENVNDIIGTLKNYLPDQIQYFDSNTVTNQSLPFLISEMVREKVFLLTDEEVPHSVTCVTEAIEKQKGSFHIHVAVIVDRDSLKRIIIGKNGSMIKEIGAQARMDIEKIIGKKIYLELFVKTIPKWRDKEKYLNEFGYYDSLK